MPSGSNEKVRVILGHILGLRSLFYGAVGSRGNSESGRDNNGQVTGQNEVEFQLRWYHSRWLEPFFGILLGALIMVALNSVVGESLTEWLHAVESRLDGREVPARIVNQESHPYIKHCSSCHGEKGEITGKEITLKLYLLTQGEESTRRVVRDGRGNMPGVGSTQNGNISDEGMTAIFSWIRANGIDQTTSRSLVGRPVDFSSSSSITLAGVDGHEKDWKSQHAGYVKNTGANTCYKCHNNQFCILCHTNAGGR